MRSRAVAKVGGMLIAALSTLVPIDAKAFPFETTPEGFTEYLNQEVKEIGGSNYKFFKPRECARVDNSSGNSNIATYECVYDLTETSSLGSRTCLNGWVMYSKYYSSISLNDDDFECSAWEKVSAIPEPQSQPTPSPSQPQTSTTTSTTLNNNLILAGGAGIFVAGGLLGVIFSQLLGRKKD